ncbi:MAG TPA: SulP family inorganic anion transporter [Steroidobacteraceae bacterium]|nr:SulP family inorganic anion transporter [Steroidobacteraceae bacterium]
MNLRLPLLDWLSQYRVDWLRPDVLAGLTTAAVVIPKAMAYATVAGLPIEIGIYTAIVPALVYAVLGTARVLSVTTTTTIAILVGAELAIVVPDGDPARLLQALATLALMVGAILMLASVLRLGFFADFVSHPVQVGFKAGIGFVIVADQVPKLLGIKIHKEGFFRDVWSILAAIPKAALITVAIGLGTIAVLALIEKFRPKWPAPLIVLGAAIAATALWALQSRGVPVVGAVPSGLPSFRLPDLSLAQAMWPAALGIALMSFTETIAVGRAFARNDDPLVRPNAELLATGAANAVGGFLGAMPAGGGASQTAVNRMTGARTQVSCLASALMAVLVALFLSPFIALMPHAALAGVVIVYSLGLIKPAEFRDMLRVRRTEFIWAVVAMLGVMVLGTLKGILVAIIVSLVALGYQAANPKVYVLGREPGTSKFRPRSPDFPGDEFEPGLLLTRLEGRLFFLNAERVVEKLRVLMNEYRPRVLVLDLRAVFDLEYSALKTITEAVERARSQGAEIWLGALQPEVLTVIKRSPLGETLGPDRMFTSIDTAVRKYREKFGAHPAIGETHA